MQKLSHIYEKELHKIWLNQSFTSKLKTLAGDNISVLDPGAFNADSAGPDFLNARIRLGALVYVGDIEIDTDYNSWKSHGHNIDVKHNKVVLHVSLINKSNQHYVYTKDGRKVPSICLTQFLNRDTIESLLENDSKKKELSTEKLKCESSSSAVEHQVKKIFIAELGINRISRKANRIYNRLKELAYLNELKIKEPVVRYDLHPDFESRKFTYNDFKDKKLWQQLFYELLFEALGYTKNKTIMLELAQAVDIKFLSEIDITEDISLTLETILFNVSGLMPEVRNLPKEDISDYTMNLFNRWKDLSKIYDGEIFDETNWHFFRTRPQNFPTIRVAGGVRYLEMILNENLIPNIITKIDQINKIPILINSLRGLMVVKSRGFWKNHYVFDQPAKQEIKYFVGVSRSDEIIINVIIPFFMVYFDVFGNKVLSKKVLEIYNNYDQKFSNRLIEDIAKGINTPDLLKKSVYAQGMLELYRSYCSKNKCDECEIGKVVFA